MLSSRDFRGTRLAVSLALLQGAMAASQLARHLGKPTGSIFGVLRRMVADGILEIDTDAPTRGTLYSLTPAAREILREVEREPDAIGRIERDQKLLLVESPAAMTTAQEVLAEGRASNLIVWAAETNGGWLLSLDTDSSYPVYQLRMALETAGAPSRELSVGDVLSGAELQERGAWLLEDVEQGP